MSTQTEVTLLVKRRKILRASLTRLFKQINEIDDNTPIELLHVKNERLLALRPEFQEIQCKLEDLDESESHEQVRFEFEDKYDELRAKLQQLINVHCTRIPSEPNNGCESIHSNAASQRLPMIRLPEFSGDVTQFMHFHDLFESLILNNHSLGNIERFHYLVSSLRGDAHQLIQNIPVTADNFNIAWDTVCKRYRNSKVIVNAHIKLLLSPDTVHKESASSLRKLLNQTQANLKAVQALNLNVPLHEVIISQLILDKLPDATRKQWEMSNKSEELSTLTELFDYLERRAQTLELINFSPTMVHSHEKSIISSQGFKRDKQPSSNSSYVAINNNCQVCMGQHPIYRCQKFLNYDIQCRRNIVKQHKLCFNCLRESHMVNSCPSKSTCKTCNGYHNTLLHIESKTQLLNASYSEQSQPRASSGDSITYSKQVKNDGIEDNSSSYCTMKVKPQFQVLLPTAIVKVKDKVGRLHLARCLLDSASQSNFISEGLVQSLGLRKIKNLTPIEGISQSASEAKYSVNIDIQSRVSNFHYNVECLVLSKITSDMPSQQVPYEEWNLPNDIQLADPKFYAPAKIDILLGADLFFRILREGHMTKPGRFPVLKDTEFGWIVSGSYQSTATKGNNASGTFFLRNDVQLHTQVQRFWEVEEICEPIQSREEIECERHFSKHVRRDASGRYIVRLPLKQDPSTLGDSSQFATTRFQYLERRLNRHGQLKNDYDKFLTEYEELGHMKIVTPTAATPVTYYMPHHPVFKKSSSTTKTRIVFDASCKSKSGKSLNDILMTGPTIQQDLCLIVARFRTHCIGFTADIEKMYRQINVDARDSSLQRILWRTSSNEPIKQYELQTVTYGTSSAPFLAIRSLRQLADDEGHQYPNATPILLRDFYVDDCISGSSNVNDALRLQRELIQLLERGGFKLRKWCSNHPALLEAVPEHCRETQLPLHLDSDETIKTLGLLWHPATDRLQISSGIQKELSITSPVTKRKVLSIVSSIYDPLGLISPIVITFKMFLQQLWQENVGWDDEIPQGLLSRWSNLYSQIPLIDNIYIDRFVLAKGFTQVQLHGFADASMKGYGACIFLRSSTDEGHVTTRFLCSKSRVAPLKQITLPRLELCAAVLLSRLFKKIYQFLSIEFQRVCLWTDSKIVLAWLSGPPTRWTTFVAHRVAEVQGSTSVNDWNHVASADNPADLISRGRDPTNLSNNDLWWYGPAWLQRSEQNWPISSEETITCVPEQRKVVLSCLTISHPEEIFSRFSSHLKLQRVLSYCLRFLHNTKCQPTERKAGPLSVEELQQTNMICIRLVQTTDFREEITALTKNIAVSKQSKLRSLVPFIDKNQILRVGGRLACSNVDYDVKHQVILPAKHHFTDLIIKHEHERLLHAGNQLTLASLRQHYWIINGKSVVRRIIHCCVKCFRFKVKTTNQLMGQLPSVRVTQARPFLNTGTDFTGPFYLKVGKPRSKTFVKGYVCIFVCMCTKAVHLEIVSDLSTQGFLAALRRFIARRGICNNIYSDNGTNFHGASRELKELKQMFDQERTQQEIVNFSSSRGITWHFIPPHSPNFGGLWEAGVKSFKHHLRRVMGTLRFTYEELSTLTAQIEACLNSRPLQSLSNDPNDLSALTPGHFLIGEPLTALPEPNLTSCNMPLLTRYKVLQQRLQSFWKRWSSDYLTHLQQRSKWTSSSSNLSTGTVVLVKEDNVPPLQWQLGVITEVHSGKDNLVRVVSVKCVNGTYKRPVSKLAPLPI